MTVTVATALECSAFAVAAVGFLALLGVLGRRLRGWAFPLRDLALALAMGCLFTRGDRLGAGVALVMLGALIAVRVAGRWRGPIGRRIRRWRR
ncbi:MAG TPA: hypothetical protein VGG54_23135 [Trebonia sp.]